MILMANYLQAIHRLTLSITTPSPITNAITGRVRPTRHHLATVRFSEWCVETAHPTLTKEGLWRWLS